MTPTPAALALAGLLALGGPAHVGGYPTAPRPDTLAGPGDSVPYVAQGPLLCGGAAAAMVERYWGALAVYAEDYADLVSREDGGILTGDLADALARRGHRVDVLTGDPEAAVEHVRAGVPVVALLESGESRFHYVVVVAVGDGEVRFHDPLRGPGRTLSRSRFMRRWAASDHWAMVAWPSRAGGGTDPAPAADRSSGGGTPPGGEAIQLPPALDQALAALRDDRSEEAAALAEEWVASGGGKAHRDTAWRIVATARYLSGRRLAALQAWNAVGEPPVDLVQVEGLGVMGYRSAARPLGVRPRDILTPASLRLARRRLLQLPAVQRGRVGYRPLRDGSVEVEAAVLERPALPRGPVEVGVAGLGALIDKRVEVGLGPFLAVGERWSLRGSWEEARPLLEVAVDVPWPLISGVVTLGTGWMEERYATGPGASRRSWGSMGLRRWMDADTRLGLTLALERWDGRGRLGHVGLSALRTFAADGVRMGLALDGWEGAGEAFQRLRAGVRATRSAGPRRWTATLGVSLASDAAPGLVQPGAGTGRIRAPLLRGHPLVRDGRIGGETLGRGLLHGTLSHAWIATLGPAAAAAAVFLDGARVWAPLNGGGPRSFLDPGMELSVSDGERTAAVSLARGGGDWVLSARVGRAGLPWLSGR